MAERRARSIVSMSEFDYDGGPSGAPPPPAGTIKRKKVVLRRDNSLYVKVVEAKGLANVDSVYCTVCLDGKEHGRTRPVIGKKAEKGKQGEKKSAWTDNCNPFWSEEFAYSNLHVHFQEAKFVVWGKVHGKVSTLLKLHHANKHLRLSLFSVEQTSATGQKGQDILIGSKTLSLSVIETGTVFDNWYTLAPTAPAEQERDLTAQLRLRCKYTENIVLPQSDYNELWQYLSTLPDGVLDAINTATPSKEEAGTAILRLYASKGCTRKLLQKLITMETESTKDGGTLFRANSILTKALEYYLKLVGAQYLQDVLGSHIAQIITAKKICEVNPSFLKGGAASNLKRNLKNLESYIVRITETIFASEGQCPVKIRYIFGDLQRLVEMKFGPEPRYTAVSAFLFLRFFCPAIMGPKLFNLTSEFPEEKVSRTLTLIAKTVQNLASLVEFGEKEKYMCPLNAYISQMMDPMRKFLDSITLKDDGLTEPEFQFDTGKEFANFCRHLRGSRKALQDLVAKPDYKHQEAVETLLQHLDKIGALHMFYKYQGTMRFTTTKDESLEVRDQSASTISLTSPLSTPNLPPLSPSVRDQNERTLERTTCSPTPIQRTATFMRTPQFRKRQSTESRSRKTHSPPSSSTTSIPILDIQPPYSPTPPKEDPPKPPKSPESPKLETVNTKSEPVMLERMEGAQPQKAEISNVAKPQGVPRTESAAARLRKPHPISFTKGKLSREDMVLAVDNFATEMVGLVSTLISRGHTEPESMREVAEEIEPAVVELMGLVRPWGMDGVQAEFSQLLQRVKATRGAAGKGEKGTEDVMKAAYLLLQATKLLCLSLKSKFSPQQGESKPEEVSSVAPSSVLMRRAFDEIAKEVEPPQGEVVMVSVSIDQTTLPSSPSAAQAAVQTCTEIVGQQVRHHMGYDAATTENSFLCAFEKPFNAVAFCLQTTEALTSADWSEDVLKVDGSIVEIDGVTVFRGPRVRMGVMRGAVESSMNDVTERVVYSGQTVDYAMQLRDTALGGQILLPESLWTVLPGRPSLKCESRPAGSVVLEKTENVVMLLPTGLAGRAKVWDKAHTPSSPAPAQRLVPQVTSSLPTGDVTMVGISIKDYSSLVSELPSAMEMSMLLVAEVLRDCAAFLGGHEVSSREGSSTHAFRSAVDAVTFASTVQSKLPLVDWPVDILDRPGLGELRGLQGQVLFRGLRAKIGIDKGQVHTNATSVRVEYKGPAVDRAAALTDMADGGQILTTCCVHECIQPLANKLDVVLTNLGSFSVSGSPQEPVWQLVPTSLCERKFLINTPSQDSNEKTSTSDVDQLLTMMQAHAPAKVSAEPTQPSESQMEIVVVDAAAMNRKQCHGCHQPIKEGWEQYVVSQGNHYHRDHFSCVDCGVNLVNSPFIRSPHGDLLCVPHYEKRFGEVCCICSEVMSTNIMFVRACNKVYHQHHFNCASCGLNLMGVPYLSMYDQPYCQKDYYDLFTEKCHACNLPLGAETIEAMDVLWHPECFICHRCKKAPQEGDAMYQYELDAYCAHCYQTIREHVHRTTGKVLGPSTRM